MKNFVIITVIPFVLCLHACGLTDTTSADIESIKSMSKARAKAFNEGDAKKITSYFTEDAVLMAPGTPPMTGPEAVEAYYQAIFDQYETRLNSYYNEVKVSGDLAYGRGTAEVILIPKNGDTIMTSTSKYLNILQKQPNGEWRTTHDIWNEN
ncbi:SgcJ/EcaC family oxidoreductase [Echinicola jeungdonensis]|uniref:YybH family protein n=1 Tax=Echinicola jeungdonensis TaxID=709343 RepID=A0ABV5J352_9BACT|nr:SgcJ/EcaC family oxidoreductase [Echinicola jeungdonensis]MDN3667979.1 SgcJ/EcaC family oxidoreductase [Echinicola jeungdonensis]